MIRISESNFGLFRYSEWILPTKCEKNNLACKIEKTEAITNNSVNQFTFVRVIGVRNMEEATAVEQIL